MKSQLTRKIETPDGRIITRPVRLLGNAELSVPETLKVARTNKLVAQYQHGRTQAGLPLNSNLVQYWDSLAAALTSEDARKQRDALLKSAREGNAEAAKTLAGIRMLNYSNYLYAPALWLGAFCEVINLAADEVAYAQRITKQETKIEAVGGDGAPRMVHIDLDPSETRIPLGYISSDIVRYRKVDVYRGRITDPALATINLAYDLGMKVNERVQTLMKGDSSHLYGAFTFTGKRANWTYVAHSTINTDNLPTTNSVVVKDSTGTKTTAFGWDVMMNIIDYCARWDGAWEDGVNLRPTGRIILPPGHIKSIMTGIYPTGATRNKIADELMDAGWFGVHFLGTDWLFIPDTTLDPDDKICYPEFNKKPVTVFFKPELDVERTSANDYTIESKNEEERYIQRVFGAYWDTSRRPWAAKFDYSGA